MGTPLRILVVYRYGTNPLRPTTKEHLDAFKRYSTEHVDYLNVEHERTPPLSELNRYDLIVFHYLFFTRRWSGRSAFLDTTDRTGDLRYARGRKVMLPQDEFLHADLLCEFINEFGIDAVFSVAPENTWEAIYRGIDFNATRFHHVLTGYVDDNFAQTLSKPGIVPVGPRTIDVGYRTAGRPYFWFGRHGLLKETIAHVFRDAAGKAGFKADISVEARDTITGDNWYRFLMNCRFTIGVEGGTSMIDRDGTIKTKTDRYVEAHPDAGYDDVARACFPGVDGTVPLYALSPRHLEACMTRTVQVLIEGEYNGVLRANDHYIPLRADFSNLDEVIERMRSEPARLAMAERAFLDVVASGRYSYRSFVSRVTELSMACPLRSPRRRPLLGLDGRLRRIRSRVRGPCRRIAKAVGLD